VAAAIAEKQPRPTAQHIHHHRRYTMNATSPDLQRRRGHCAARHRPRVAYESVRTGEIPATRVGRRWLIPRRRFHAWLDGEGPARRDNRRECA
jgi:hypothetical protein